MRFKPIHGCLALAWSVILEFLVKCWPDWGLKFMSSDEWYFNWLAFLEGDLLWLECYKSGLSLIGKSDSGLSLAIY